MHVKNRPHVIAGCGVQAGPVVGMRSQCSLPWRSEAVASPGPAGAGEAGHPLSLPLLLELPLQLAGLPFL